MPNDLITLKAIAFELNDELQNGRVDKINMPENDEINIIIRAKLKNQILVISASSSSPRLHLSNVKKDNQLTAPSFCMLLRKYLTGSSLLSCDIFNNDRIICLTFLNKTELKDTVKYRLMVELMGRYSNIVLINENDVILDALRRISFDIKSDRYIMPSLKYVAQNQPKLLLTDTDKILQGLSNQSDVSQFLISEVSGLSKFSAKEIATYDNVIDGINTMVNINIRDKYQPCILLKENKPSDYYVYPYSVLSGEFKFFNTINDAVCDFYTQKDVFERKKQKTQKITTIIKRLITKTEKKIEDCTAKINDLSSENLKIQGELITTYSYNINKNDKLLTCLNYYTNENITIALDENLSAIQNAQLYYKKYSKSKKAKDYSLNALPVLTHEREYLNSILTSIENCATDMEYKEIDKELNAFLSIHKKDKDKTKIKPSKPTKHEIDGFEIYIGKNNYQNEMVTFELSNGNDIWLHAKDHHGAHAIIKSKDGNVPIDIILKVATLVAKFSSAKNSDKVSVDYTLKKFVKRHPKGLKGMVTYSNEKNLYVTTD